MSFLLAYALFLAKLFTALFAILIAIASILTIFHKTKGRTKHKLCVKNLSEKYQALANTLNTEILTKQEKKENEKKQKNLLKKKRKQIIEKRIFVLNFQGDIRASAVNGLREEITAILQVAKPKDEVVLKLESSGGMVSPYGLAASQLQRLKNKHIHLTVSVDKVAASGGYLMACVADKILAAPFATIGSIGVVAQLPNFHRLLKKKNIDFELLTAGEYKRTLTLFGENTEKARKKTQEDLEEIHHLFKKFIQKHREKVDIQKVATGAYWLAEDALDLGLVDELTTSDDYLSHKANQPRKVEIYELNYLTKRSIVEKLGGNLQQLAGHLQWF